MYNDRCKFEGNMIHIEEKTIHRSNTLTRNRDSNRTLIGDNKEKECVSRTRLQVRENKSDTTCTRHDWTRDLTGGVKDSHWGKEDFQRKTYPLERHKLTQIIHKGYFG